jgi:hypothetical protein
MPAPAELVADASATEESQTESQAMVGGSQAPKVGLRRPFVIVVGTLLGSAAVVSYIAKPGEASTDEGIQAVSKSSVASTAVVWRTGCSNWNKILMKSIAGVANKESCAIQCNKLSGCVAANYQTNNCQDNDESAGQAAGQCNLYGGHCEEEENACWDLMKLAGSSTEPSAHRTGCKNFDKIKMGHPTFFDNQYQCVDLCSQTSKCTSVNFQPGKCSGEKMAGKGACFMFSAPCEKEANPCWDLFEEIGTTSSTSAPATTSTA